MSAPHRNRTHEHPVAVMNRPAPMPCPSGLDLESPDWLGTLPCIGCGVLTPVSKSDEETAYRIRCMWTVCDACEQRIAKLA